MFENNHAEENRTNRAFVNHITPSGESVCIFPVYSGTLCIPPHIRSMSRSTRLFLSALLAIPLTVGALVLGMLLLASDGNSMAAGGRTGAVILEPHCPLPRNDCAFPPAAGGGRNRTEPLIPNETVDLDIVVSRPHLLPTGRLRARISFNPALLRGELLSMGDQVKGSVTFLPQRGIAEIDAALPLRHTGTIVLGRVRFTVVRIAAAETMIVLHDELDDPVRMPEAEEDQRTTIAVRFAADPAEKTVGALAASPTDAREPPSDDPSFARLKLQFVVATLDGDNIHLNWIRIPSSDVKGYRIVYGTGSRLYTRSLHTGVQNTRYVFRNLSKGTTYYFSVLAVRNDGTESALSAETSATVGRQEFVGI